MKTKYFNDAVIGNDQILASYSKNGELLRLYYPTRDNKQFLDYFETGVKINDSSLIYLHQDINNQYKQKYIEDTNILTTEIKNTYFNLKMVQTDFVPIKNNVLIKRYLFVNENTINLDVKFFIHSKLHTAENNLVGSKLIDKGIVQYAHDFALSIFSNKVERTNHQLNDTGSNIQEGYIHDKDYIGMAPDASVCYDLGTIKPKEKKYIDIMITITENCEKQIEEETNCLKKLDIIKEQALTENYWKRYLKKHDTFKFEEPRNAYEEKIQEMYRRTILYFPLLVNQETGGISAAVEVDEERTRCGRYSYCWTRDAVFITRAMDLLGMKKEVEKFYKNFCKKTQSEDGKWEQRFYTDGSLAPCWGYQVDETASVIYGVWEHYKFGKDKKFLKDTLKMCEKANRFLQRYMKDLLLKTNEIHVSYDLWEMHEGINMYSISSIFAAFYSMNLIYDEIYNEYEENRIKQEQIREEKKKIEEFLIQTKEYIVTAFYDNEKKSFVRNLEDRWMDVSIIGAVVPFQIFTPKEKKITNTVERIDLTLRTYTGGYKRFENDNYMNGNPWTITTLWMALYHIEKGEKSKAKEELRYVVNTCEELGLISEQINNETMKPAWVMGLRMGACNVYFSVRKIIWE